MVRKVFITTIALLMTMASVSAESLFTLSAAQTYNAVPKSLYSGVRAMTIGDLVSIVIDEKISSSDTLSFTSSKASNTVDRFTTFLNQFFKNNLKDTNNFGGENTVENSNSTSRAFSYGDTISAQVVQLLGNGNMLIQGKKTVVNGNERIDLIISGIVDPRWINATGEIPSSKVANLQFALSGRGSISRGQNEGIINRFIRYLF